MSKKKIVFFSPVNPFGDKFGGSLDVREQIELLSLNNVNIFVFYPDFNQGVRKIKLNGSTIILISKRKSLSLFRIILFGAALGRKPFFNIKSSFFNDKILVFQGVLTLAMSFSWLFCRKKILRVHNKESVFHYDRFKSSKSFFLKMILFFEFIRLYFIEGAVYPFFKKIFISKSEFLRFSKGSSEDILFRYFPTAFERGRPFLERENSIFVLANLSLDENFVSLMEFINVYKNVLLDFGIQINVYGRNVDRLYDQELPKFVNVYGDISFKEEVDEMRKSKFYLVSSHNRGGYKTRISQSLSYGCFPLLHGVGAEINAVDFLLPCASSVFNEYSVSKLSEQLDYSSDLYLTGRDVERSTYVSIVKTN